MKVINPNMPEPYIYETDYRKIPREYLDPRIPRGRGIIKWNAFKTMPQQYAILDQYIGDQNKVDIPLLSDDQLQLINEKVQYKMKNHIISDISYWSNGYISTLQCYISNVDILERIMLVTSKKNELKIPLNYIVSVE
ncbi:TPA: YolD-like family protein [Staphylococcus aureus]|nr:YolD-like family protein [Staphylococcus aureus]HDG8359168.1 YolD-like family protein [Staphylococcus aureus]HDG8362180.1 YolD-like family protein [Staphylococcus aureus]HDG8373164.1 YolD-like family protein [Staphylococcus aureus]HDG8383696.1 YolD-like family protein [Staphylococcus aureus]